MDWYHVVSLIITTLAVPTLIGLIWKEIVEYKKKKKEESAKDKKEKEEKKLVDNIETAVSKAIAPVEQKLDRIEGRLSLVENSSQASLRNDLLKCYRECSDKGYRTSEDTQNWFKMYQAYHDLKGNSFIDQTKIDFNNILTEDQFEHENKNNKK